MSTAPIESPEADLRRRKRRGWLIIGACFASLLALFGWSLFGPNPPLVVSKQTTYITSPLRPDGTPDYARYMLSQMDRKLPRDQNAAVVMLQVKGPGDAGSGEYSPEDWQRLESEIGSLKPPDGISRITLSSHSDLTDRVMAWLPSVAPEGGNSSEPLDPWNVIYCALDRKWTKNEAPPLAEWVEKHEETFQYLLQGSSLPGYYYPQPSTLGSSDIDFPLLDAPTIEQQRDVARLHMLYGQLAWGQQDYRTAAQHFAAVSRWGKHFETGSTFLEQIVALSVKRMRLDDAEDFAADPNVPVDDLNILLHAIEATMPRADIARILANGERFFALDSALQSIKSPAGLEPLLDDPVPILWQLPRTRLNKNQVLEIVNSKADQLITIARIKAYPQRQMAIENWDIQMEQMAANNRGWRNFAKLLGPSSRSHYFGEQLAELTMSASEYIFQAVDRHEAQRQLTLVALALAINRAEQGAYPAKLDDLQPPLAADSKVDTFHGRPLGYELTADGFLLYSCGPNGADDHGDSNPEAPGVSTSSYYSAGFETEDPDLIDNISSTADDFSVRLPRPIEPWPWEVNAANLKAMEGTEGEIELSAP